MTCSAAMAMSSGEGLGLEYGLLQWSLSSSSSLRTWPLRVWCFFRDLSVSKAAPHQHACIWRLFHQVGAGAKPRPRPGSLRDQSSLTRRQIEPLTCLLLSCPFVDMGSPICPVMSEVMQAARSARNIFPRRQEALQGCECKRGLGTCCVASPIMRKQKGRTKTQRHGNSQDVHVVAPAGRGSTRKSRESDDAPPPRFLKLRMALLPACPCPHCRCSNVACDGSQESRALLHKHSCTCSLII